MPPSPGVRQDIERTAKHLPLLPTFVQRPAATVGDAVILAPVVALAAGQAQPVHQLQGPQPGALVGPMVDQVHDAVSRVARGSDAGQFFPRLLPPLIPRPVPVLSATGSCISSARASSRWRSLCSSRSMVCSALPTERGGAVWRRPLLRSQRVLSASGRTAWG